MYTLVHYHAFAVIKYTIDFWKWRGEPQHEYKNHKQTRSILFSKSLLQLSSSWKTTKKTKILFAQNFTFQDARKKNPKESIDRSPNRNNRTILKAREIFKIVAERLLKKKTSIIRIKSREIQSPYISFPLQTPFPPICLTLRSTFPPLFAANFPLLRANSLLNAFTPVFFTTHIPWYISRPWANPLANAKTTLYPPPSPTCRKLQVHHRCGVLHPR